MTTEFTPEELKAQIESTYYVIQTLKSKLLDISNEEAGYYITPIMIYQQRALIKEIKFYESYLEYLKLK